MERLDLKPNEIRDYAFSLQWTIVKEALADGILLFNSPYNDYDQLAIPVSEADSEYAARVQASILQLAARYKKSPSTIVSEIRAVNDDVLALRYYSENSPVNSLSFQEALEAMDATRQLILAAASSVAHPAIFHPRLNRAEPQELLRQARFRHTQEGSFIIQVACPFEMPMQPQHSLPLEQPTKPFSRSTVELINASARMIQEAVVLGQVEALYDRESASDRPTLSYNFCDALTRLFGERQALPFEMQFRWSLASRAKLPWPALPAKIDFPYSSREIIEDVRRYFAPARRDISARFVGTVETLDGDFSDEGRRSGSAILQLLHEEELVKARVHLNADQYAVALHVHQTQGAYIQLTGDLKREKSRNVIDNISEFKITGETAPPKIDPGL